MLKTKVEINLEVGSEYTKKENSKMNMQNEEKKKQERMEKLGFYYDQKNKLILDHNQFVETLTSENNIKLYEKGYAIYEENYWKQLKQRDIGVLIREEIKKVNKAFYEPFHHRQITETLKYEIDEIDEINCFAYKMNFKNCTFNFKTLQIEDHDSANYFSYIKDYDLSLSEETETPVFDLFMETIFENNKELIKYMTYLTGYLLSGTKTRQKFYICSGSGSNGKSTYLELLEKMIGEEFVLATPITKISSKFGLGGAHGKKMIKASENQNKSTSIDTEVLKNLTGGDRVEIEQKFKEAKTVKLNLELIFSANSILKFDDDSDGFKRRLEVIPFNAKITNPDITLSERLEKEIPAIVNKVIKAFIQGTEKGIVPCQEIIAETEKYIKKAIRVNIGETITNFLDKYVSFKQYASENKSNVYEYFLEKEKNSFAIPRETFWKGFYKWAEVKEIPAREIRNGERFIQNIEMLKDPKDIKLWEQEIQEAEIPKELMSEEVEDIEEFFNMKPKQEIRNV